jgi:peptidoglycan hydrolase CwlO-like protein
MSTIAKKIFGLVMISLSAIGVLLSIFLIVEIWRFRQPVTGALQAGLDHTTSLLQTTDDGLYIINQVVSNVYSSTQYLDDATQTLADTMQSTNSFIDTASSFVGQDLASTITNTQTALSSAEASAAVVDNILGAITNIPFIGLNYNPGTPLSKAIAGVSSSLDPVQNSLKSFQSNLQSTQSNMQSLGDQIESLNSKIVVINQNLSQAKSTIESYRTQVNSLKATVTRVKGNLSAWVTGIAALLTVIILILLMLQVAIILQGITLLAPERTSQVSPDQES